VRAKNFGKKIVAKSVKIPFLYSHEYREQKMGVGKCGKQFFQKHTNMFNQKCWEKNRRKNFRKNVFYIHSNIVTKKWWEKMRETIFPETHEWLEQKCWKKIDAKKCKKRFFTFTRISFLKKWGEKRTQ